MSTGAITLDGLAIGYRLSRRREKRIASDLRLRVDEGQFTVLLGPNGAGKSTLLRTVCGLQDPLEGRVLLSGRDLASLPARERARSLGVVLTERVDTWGLTVWDLVALGRAPHTRWSGRLTEQDRTAVATALAETDTEDFAGRKVSELSDGEKQRVLVARALAQEPAVLVLDEVTAFLDLARRVEIMQLLRRLAHTSGKTLLLSTHDLDLALRTADRLWLIDRRGEVYEGCPEDLVLAGSLAEVFRYEGLEYDPASGRVELNQPLGERVGVVGSGVPALWTQHALERLGFRVDREGGDAVVALVEVEGEEPYWRLHCRDHESCHSTLEDLTRELGSQLQTAVA
ncbi:MAG: ABC transporter ATP-binding protein [Thermoanaerobaculia bacterium]|nr:ABC transporter ATP-binding protein [Thermoanaerobaculia bacterium]